MDPYLEGESPSRSSYSWTHTWRENPLHTHLTHGPILGGRIPFTLILLMDTYFGGESPFKALFLDLYSFQFTFLPLSILLLYLMCVINNMQMIRNSCYSSLRLISKVVLSTYSNICHLSKAGFFTMALLSSQTRLKLPALEPPTEDRLPHLATTSNYSVSHLIFAWALINTSQTSAQYPTFTNSHIRTFLDL